MDHANAKKKFIQNDLYTEKEPVSSKCSMEIINLTKATVDDRILDNISLKFYENHLTCLVINNSITENALISMIMKLQYPDSGSIHIYDNNKRDRIKYDYRNIGYMPTYKIMISELTVEENLWFYTKLKNSEMNIKIKNIEGIMKSSQLYDARYTLANQLPPNLLRRLCVAIAFVGKSEIVLLQDPFSGLDFYSKQVMCDMLAQYKMGRTILMTTNQVDDARIISDKIAIINDGRLLCHGSKTFLKTIFTKGFEIKIELDNDQDIISIVRKIKFLSLPENFETDIKNGLRTDRHLTNIFLQISRYFFTNSYFVEKKGQKYIFIMPYIMKEEIYDCMDNTLALRKLFSLLDKCKNEWKTLKYEFSTSTINEVHENIKLFEMSNLNNRNIFLYEDVHSIRHSHKSIHLDIITDSTTIAKTINVDYSILSLDPDSKNTIGFPQILKMLQGRFRRNYRNHKFVLQLFLAPFLILYFTTIWTRYSPAPPIIYPAPLSILLNTNDADVFVKGAGNSTFNASIETSIGNLTMKALIYFSPTLYIKNLENKCVYLMEYTNTDISGCKKGDITCLITTTLNNSESSIGLGYMYIYETIFTNMCQMRNTTSSQGVPRDTNIKSLSPHSKCFCNDKDGKSTCPDRDRLKLIQIALYNIYSIDSYSSIPAYLASLSIPPKIIGGFENLIKNESDNKLIKKECHFKMQELLLKATQNITSKLTPKTLYENQIHYLRYMSYISSDNTKIWFNNHLKIGMPSILSKYDIAYFRSITSFINVNDRQLLSFYNNISTEIEFSRMNRREIFSDENLAIKYIDIYEANDYGTLTINHPIHYSGHLNLSSIIYLYIIIWVQSCVISLITTIILEDMFEDTHCYSHRFQFYKIKPLFHTFLNIIYTNWIYILSVNVCILVFKIQYFVKFNHLYGILIYMLYGWALIPFMLIVTYLRPKCRLLDLNIINNGIGFLCLLLEFTIGLFELRNLKSMLIITVLLPHYGFEKVLFTLIGTTFKPYEIRYLHKSEVKWEYMTNIFISLFISGIFYYTIVCCYELNIFIRGKEFMKKYFMKSSLIQYIYSQMAIFCCKKNVVKSFPLQENIFMRKLHENIKENKVIELERMEVEKTNPDLYPLLVKSLSIGKLSQISIKGENGCCSGLLGLNSDMAPFVSLLTGESIPFQGEIYIQGHNTKINKFKLQNSIGYALKDIYLNIYLTPRESLEFYTFIKYKLSTLSKKVVDFLINHFDIRENHWIKDCLDSTKRKLVFAIALMMNQPILILAEPFKGLNMIDTLVVGKTIGDMIAMDKCVIVLSNSIKNCHYFTNLSIFGDKGIKCFGSIQDLRTRYSNGYMVSIEFNKNRQEKFCYSTNHLLAQRLLGTFPSSQILEYHMSYIKICIIVPDLQISRIFVTLEAVRNLYDIDDYYVGLASLEEVLSKFSNSHEDFINDNITPLNRPCEIPYDSETCLASHL